MRILSSHIQTYDNQIDVNKSICTILNAYLKAFMDEPTSPFFNAAFITGTDNFVLFQLEFDEAKCQKGHKEFMTRFQELFSIKPNAITFKRTKYNLTLIRFLNVNGVIDFFQKMGYEALLADEEEFCLAYQIDLMQYLMADTIKSVLMRYQYHPEKVEFDQSGHVNAIIISDSNKRYQLNNTFEVISLIKHYCKYNLSPLFVDLLRKQITINTKRQITYLLRKNAEGIPKILTTNQLSQPHLCPMKKIFSCHLIHRDLKFLEVNVLEQRVFQEIFARLLGPEFQLEWKFDTNQQMRLNVGMKAGEWSNWTIRKLKNKIETNQLLNTTLLNAINFRELLGPIQTLSIHVPQAITDILACKILFTLPDPDEALFITPSGYTYSSAILQHLEMNDKKDPTTRSPLDEEMLRRNLLAERLAAYCQNTKTDLTIEPPPFLYDSDAGEFYQHPVVAEDGETIEASSPNQNLKYRNRCVDDLIQYYQTSLKPMAVPVIRSGIRATIAANLNLICPGSGALSREAAADEAESALPYIKYNPLTATLVVYFISLEYARRFELGLKSWRNNNKNTIFNSDNLILENVQTRIIVTDVDESNKNILYHSKVSISGDSAILILFEKICSLPSIYFEALKGLSGFPDLEVINHVLEEMYCPKMGTASNSQAMHASQPITRSHSDPTSSSHTKANALNNIQNHLFSKHKSSRSSSSSEGPQSHDISQTFDIWNDAIPALTHSRSGLFNFNEPEVAPSNYPTSDSHKRGKRKRDDSLSP